MCLRDVFETSIFSLYILPASLSIVQTTACMYLFKKYRFIVRYISSDASLAGVALRERKYLPTELL